MFFSVVAVVICGVAGFQAYKGTTNMAAKLAVYGFVILYINIGACMN